MQIRICTKAGDNIRMAGQLRYRHGTFCLDKWKIVEVFPYIAFTPFIHEQLITVCHYEIVKIAVAAWPTFYFYRQRIYPPLDKCTAARPEHASRTVRAFGFALHGAKFHNSLII